MHKIRKITDSKGEDHFVIGDLLQYCGVSRGKASRHASNLPSKYVQTSLIKDSSGSEQKTLLAHKLAAVILLSTVVKGGVSELLKHLTGANVEEQNWKFTEIPTTEKVRTGNCVSTIHHKIVEPVYTTQEKKNIERGSKPLEVIIGRRKYVDVFNPSTGVTKRFNGSMEQYLAKGKDSPSNVKYPPQQKPLTYIDDKGNTRERNTMRIVKEAHKIQAEGETDNGVVSVRQEALSEETLNAKPNVKEIGEVDTPE